MPAKGLPPAGAGGDLPLVVFRGPPGSPSGEPPRPSLALGSAIYPTFSASHSIRSFAASVNCGILPVAIIFSVVRLTAQALPSAECFERLSAPRLLPRSFPLPTTGSTVVHALGFLSHPRIRTTAWVYPGPSLSVGKL